MQHHAALRLVLRAETFLVLSRYFKSLKHGLSAQTEGERKVGELKTGFKAW